MDSREVTASSNAPVTGEAFGAAHPMPPAAQAANQAAQPILDVVPILASSLLDGERVQINMALYPEATRLALEQFAIKSGYEVQTRMEQGLYDHPDPVVTIQCKTPGQPLFNINTFNQGLVITEEEMDSIIAIAISSYRTNKGL